MGKSGRQKKTLSVKYVKIQIILKKQDPALPVGCLDGVISSSPLKSTIYMGLLALYSFRFTVNRFGIGGGNSSPASTSSSSIAESISTVLIGSETVSSKS